MSAAMQSKTLLRCMVLGRWILMIGIMSILVDYAAIAHLNLDYPPYLRLTGTTCSAMFILCGLGTLYRVRWGYYLMLVAMHFMLCCPRMRPHAKELIRDVFRHRIKERFDRKWLLFSWRLTDR